MKTVQDLNGFFTEMFGQEKLKQVYDEYGSAMSYIFYEGEGLVIPDYEFMEKEGGTEGSGEYCHVVFKYKDIYYKIVGTYQSYYGAPVDEENLFIVTPQEKMVTVYE